MMATDLDVVGKQLIFSIKYFEFPNNLIFRMISEVLMCQLSLRVPTARMECCPAGSSSSTLVELEGDAVLE